MSSSEYVVKKEKKKKKNGKRACEKGYIIYTEFYNDRMCAPPPEPARAEEKNFCMH